MAQWRMKGEYIANCNCDFGCPCDFESKPTRNNCEGILGMNVVEGNYGDLPLSGLRWALTYSWPGPLYEGNGTAQPFIDARADEKQREALLKIISGRAGGPWFEVLDATVSNFLEAQFVEIDFKFDMEKRNGRVAVNGACETEIEPIRSPVTGEEHRAQISLPEGVEFKLAEVACAAVLKGTGAIKFDWSNVHAALAEVEYTNDGVM